MNLRLKSDLSSSLGKFLMGFARFVNETVGVYRICVVELILSASNVLELELLAMVETFRSAERSGTVPSSSTVPLGRSTDQLS